jgi:hypothetical protein
MADEPKKVSRQRRWQMKQAAAGKCIICGNPICKRSSRLCEKHRLQANVISTRHQRKMKIDNTAGSR